MRRVGRTTGGWALIGGLMFGGPIAAQGPAAPQGSAVLPGPQATTLATRPLLEEPSVQRELKLTAAQRERLANLDREATQARQEASDFGEEGFDFATMLGQARQVDQERTRATGRILTATQKHRLTQIEWQREGWPILARPEVAARLKLPTEVREKIARVVERLREDEARSIFTSGTSAETVTGRKLRADLKPTNGFIDPSGGGFADGGPLHFSTDGMAEQDRRHAEAVARLRADAAREVAGLLSDAQRSAFSELLGPRFDPQATDPPAPTPSAGPERTDPGSRAKSKKSASNPPSRP